MHPPSVSYPSKQHTSFRPVRYNFLVSRRARAYAHFRKTLGELFEVAPGLRPCAELVADTLESLPDDAPDPSEIVRPFYKEL